MKSWIWLRVASGLYAVFAVLHGSGYVAEPDGPPEQKAITDAMRNFRFEIMGSNRSAWDFFRGFGLMFILNVALLAVLTWLLSNLARSSPAQARPIAWALVVGQILLTVICWTKFFIAPGLLSTLIALFLAVAAVGLQRSDKANSA